MSPIALRPSSLGPVKRKFELDDNYSNSYSPPPFKKIFSDRWVCNGTRPLHFCSLMFLFSQLFNRSLHSGQSPCQSPSLQTCPSPDSTEGRTTPKLYISKLYATNTNSSSSLSSSPSAVPSPSSAAAMEIQIEIPNVLTCNRSISVSSLSDTTQACKLETHNDFDGSDIVIDYKCTKEDDNVRKLEIDPTTTNCKNLISVRFSRVTSIYFISSLFS